MTLGNHIGGQEEGMWPARGDRPRATRGQGVGIRPVFYRGSGERQSFWWMDQVEAGREYMNYTFIICIHCIYINYESKKDMYKHISEVPCLYTGTCLRQQSHAWWPCGTFRFFYYKKNHELGCQIPTPTGLISSFMAESWIHTTR